MRFRTTLLAELPTAIRCEPPLYFVSDLHMGDGSPADDFAEGEHEAAFEWFLENEVEPAGGNLVLLGDVFELWQCQLGAVREAYPNFYWRLQNYRLIRGNHDSAYGKPPEWRWPDGHETLLLAEHGHRADPLNSDLGLVGWAVTAFAGLLERLGWRDIDQNTWRWKWMPTPLNRPSRFPPGHYESYARKRARETGARIVVLGHTHRPELSDLGAGVVYANCGCWVEPEYAGSFVRIMDGRVQLWLVEAGGRSHR